jgi:hypothetical protein
MKQQGHVTAEVQPAKFPSLEAAITALHASPAPLVLVRFAPMPEETTVIAVNDAAAANPTTPLPGDHPDTRRDHALTADVEIDYLYRQLVSRGHARQVISLDGGHFHEISVNRIEIRGDDAIYGFVSATERDQAGNG